VSCASAAAANAPTSSLRTPTHSIPAVRRMPSTTGFKLSPTTPYTRLTPAAIKTSISWSATVVAMSYFLSRLSLSSWNFGSGPVIIRLR
jgi:hypothetical protein